MEKPKVSDLGQISVVGGEKQKDEQFFCTRLKGECKILWARKYEQNPCY